MQVNATHLTSLFEHATEGIILTNQQGRIVLVNPAALHCFGYEAGELVNQPVEALIPESNRNIHEQMRKNYYDTPRPWAMGHGRELLARKKDGASFPVEVSLSYYKQNDELFVIAFIVDISFRKQIEQSMKQQKKELEKVTDDVRKMNMELELKVEERTVILKEALMKLEQSQQELSEALNKEKELNEIKSRFVSMASHEFRTPLSTVLSSASLLAKYTGAGDQEKRDKHINRIKESVAHLNDILEDFLSFGRLDEGKVSTHCSEFDLKELVQDTIESMKSLLKKDQELVCMHNGRTLVYSDKKLLKNILVNLVANAIKFSHEGLPITISSKVEGGRAEISVEDKGIGIALSDQEHLFTSFFRAKNAVNIQGTGLGLHIVKRYLDLLGGEVCLQSELNKGTKVTFTIPVQQPLE